MQNEFLDSKIYMCQILVDAAKLLFKKNTTLSPVMHKSVYFPATSLVTLDILRISIRLTLTRKIIHFVASIYDRWKFSISCFFCFIYFFNIFFLSLLFILSFCYSFLGVIVNIAETYSLTYIRCKHFLFTLKICLCCVFWSPYVLNFCRVLVILLLSWNLFIY